MFFPPREDRLLGGGPDIFHPRSGGNWWKLVQREPQYGDPYAVTREREREFPREKNLPWRRPISISRCWLQPWSPFRVNLFLSVEDSSFSFSRCNRYYPCPRFRLWETLTDLCANKGCPKINARFEPNIKESFQ